MSKIAVKTLLIIEDNPGDARLLREMLRDDTTYPAHLVLAGTMAEAETCLAANGIDIILLDLGLPDAQGIEAIRRARMAAPGTPLVVLTGADDDALAASSLQEGAQDYLIKGEIETRSLLRALRYASERKRLERLKDEFVATVSHELRTPLTSITGSLGLLMGSAAGVLPAPAARLLKIAHTNCQRLVRLVNDILDIEKLESGQVVFDLRKVEVRALIEQAVDANRGFAETHNVRLRIEGATSAVANVRADTDRLAQVVTNLLSNAVKFSSSGSEVVIDIEKGIDLVRINVRDHGPGISEAFKLHIFERFAQADASNIRRKGGTGLGLSIVKQIVERLGGKVGFADAPGGGTTFYIELPSWGGVSDVARDQLIATGLQDAEASLAALMDAATDVLGPSGEVAPDAMATRRIQA